MERTSSYRIEEEFITKATGEEKYLPFLIEAARSLEKGGADFIVIPCNSVHILIDEVRKSVNIPVLSIIEETINYLKEKHIEDVGLLATSATIRKRLYEDKLIENKIKIINPQDTDQEQMGEIINNLVHSQHNNIDREKLLTITQNLISKGVKTVLLACTDLQLITPVINNIEVIDTMEILAKATVREILD